MSVINLFESWPLELDKFEALYKTLYQNPEVSLQEAETSAILSDMDSLKVTERTKEVTKAKTSEIVPSSRSDIVRERSTVKQSP